MEEKSDKAKRLHARVEGNVQGVGFRAFVEQTAFQLGLQGWVRNRWDGSVEVMVEGETEILEKMLAALNRGPRAASVRYVDADWQSATGEFSGFNVRRTD